MSSAPPHIWAVAAIVGLLCINLSKDSGYLSITYSSSTGAFVGNLVDIATSRGAAARDLDRHVPGHRDRRDRSLRRIDDGGSGAVAMEYMSGSGVPESIGAAAIATSLALLLCAVLERSTGC